MNVLLQTSAETSLLHREESSRGTFERLTPECFLTFRFFISGTNTHTLCMTYFLQVENEPFQDGVEGLPASFPSRRCEEEET